MKSKGSSEAEKPMWLFIGLAFAGLVLILFALLHYRYSSIAGNQIVTTVGGLLFFEGAKRKKGGIEKNLFFVMFIVIISAVLLLALWGMFDQSGQKMFARTMASISDSVRGVFG